MLLRFMPLRFPYKFVAFAGFAAFCYCSSILTLQAAGGGEGMDELPRCGTDLGPSTPISLLYSAASDPIPRHATRLLIRAGWSQEQLSIRPSDANTVFSVHQAHGPFASLLVQFALPGESQLQTGLTLRQLQLQASLPDAQQALPDARSRIPSLELPILLAWRLDLPPRAIPAASWSLIPSTGLQVGFLGSGLESNLPDAPFRYIPRRPNQPRLQWENSLALAYRFEAGHRMQLSVHHAAGLLEAQTTGTLQWKRGDRFLEADVRSRGTHWRIGLGFGWSGKAGA